MSDNTPGSRTLLQFAAAAAAILLSSARAEAQTYYYIDQIVVTPSSPTTADAITITVNGALSNTASYIVNTGFNVIGNTVQLNINAGMQGIGLDVLVPHSESFSIGQLAAGTYAISISGSAILDSAPEPEHQFTVSGGTPTDCDSLDIISVLWGVFSTDQIIVTAANASSDLFDYPGFVLLDPDGDTLAKETVNYFGIGPSPQQHILEVMDGAQTDGNTLQGQLHLWSDLYAEQECQFDGTWSLCPTTECAMVVPYLVNMGNALADAEIPYSLENSDGLAMATGTFHLMGNIQSDYEPGVCLPPDEYTLQLDQIGVVGGQLFYGVSGDIMNWQQAQESYEQGTAENTLPFAVFASCIDDNNSVAVSPIIGSVELRIDGDHLLIMAPAGSSIGPYQLLDAKGLVVGMGALNADQGRIPLAQLSSGMYSFRSASFGPVRFVR